MTTVQSSGEERVKRAEEKIGRAGEEIGSAGASAAKLIVRTASRAREELTDMVAEAQTVRKRWRRR